MGTFRVVYEDNLYDDVVATHERFWRKDAKIEVFYLVVKPSLFSYTGLAGYWVPVRKNIEFIEELLND